MSPKLRATIHRILFATGALTASVAYAEPQQADSGEIAEIVIVTGSFIKGTPEDAALPVEVIGSEELEKQGAPSTLDLLKSTPVMTGIIGESNQFVSGRGQAAQGSASINLRGFGAARTLVLLNGKRLATDDANLIPSAAIARVEILKDGGASTYGSDAIGGVVNFITKDKVDGLELGADYRYIEDSDGDYNASLAWGTSGDSWDFFVSGDYFHRSELLNRDRDWTLRSFQENPLGGWTTGSNPGSFRYLIGSTLGTQIADPGCEAMGGVLVSLGASGNQCQTQYTPWLNLVEEQDTYRLFTQFNVDLTDSTSLHVEAMYANTNVPEAKFSPSYTTTRRITATAVGPQGAGVSTEGGVLDPGRTGLFLVPGNNPGFQAMLNAGLIPAGASRGYITINQWRPMLAGGNPTFDSGASESEYDRQQARFSAELTGEIGSIGWTVNGTYGMSETKRYDVDIVTGRLQYALRGLGGENCDVAGAIANNTYGQNGCLWFNPFSNAIPGIVLPGNPAAVPNSNEVINWMQEDLLARNKAEIAEFNVVLNGELPLSLPGGAVGWAAGAQYRHTWTDSSNNYWSNTETMPCPDTPLNGDMTCFPTPESPYNFLATNNPQKLDRGVYAVFSEVNLPVTDAFNAAIAARFEDYGNKGGSSFDPKLSLRYQVIDQLAFRGSVSTTFRAPPQASLIPEENIGFTSILGSNRPVATVGNPDLEPEEAFTWSVGSIINVGNFRATIDYWRFDIDKLLGVEPTAGILSRVFPNGTAGANNCATVDQAWLNDHFDFADGVCAANNILKVTRKNINGAGLVNDGIDVQGDYTFENVFGGSLVLGAAATWIHKYETETLTIDGIVYEDGFDGVGQLNQGTTLYALPEWRAQGYVDFSFGNQNIRWTANYVDQYRDQRYATNAALDSLIDATILHNVTYRTVLPGDVTLLATIENVFDKDPSFALLELSYDPLTGNALGRTFKLGLRKSF